MMNPEQPIIKFKIFETDIIDEVEKEEAEGIVSNELDEELQDLFQHNFLVIPVFVRPMA